MMKAVFFAVVLALSDAADPLKLLEELDPISKQVAATLEDALEKSNIETPWGHLEEFKEIRRLQLDWLSGSTSPSASPSSSPLAFGDTGVKGSGATEVYVPPPASLDAQCKKVCPNLEKTLNNVIKDETHFHATKIGPLKQWIQKVTSQVKDVQQLIWKLRPMFEELYHSALKNMCAGRKSYVCMVTNKEKCKMLSHSWTTDNALLFGPHLECICDKCSFAKDAYIKAQATYWATRPETGKDFNIKMPEKGGPPMQASLKEKYDKEWFAALCPLSGAFDCFKANQAQCGGKFREHATTLWSQLNTMPVSSSVWESRCAANKISTKAESVKIAPMLSCFDAASEPPYRDQCKTEAEIASNTMPVRMPGTVAALACTVLFLQ